MARKRNKEKARQWRHSYYLANKARENAKTIEWQRANPEKIHGYKLKRYGLTVEQYEALLKKQNGVCAICKKPPTEKYRLVVDHDHKCCAGKNACGACVRGLLCKPCNTAIGMLGDDIVRLQNAITYLGVF